ncbi:NADH-ubiquinone oxidoreductase-F iron-sulfur binding region domain-containing protein [Nocardioides sp.]|uniref:NADH-ubiquinone oxidoreductase-F iron-sulfur binding region domain-containing protein n=1 Tax=Nocardioides sp. TaxID=35761 RepID=UPI0025E8691E|nr:NADH-ubiquinone oxidoreductase-F iron-sulfur binding region domain-containing protein [Nocardioides sp.]
MSASPVPVPTEVHVRPGPALLAGIAAGPGLAAHREQYGALPRIDVDTLLAALGRLRVRGRGGAAFPFEVKLRTAADRSRHGRRPVVVVNLSEGEPASAKDSALALMRPHLVLDGAVATAYALGARELHVVVPQDRPLVGTSIRAALAERRDPMRTEVHVAASRFVAGQARAVLELMAGRPNLPVTAWSPEAVAGHRGRPTLLSNAETWAQVGLLVLGGEERYAASGTPDEPGTTLLTLVTPSGSTPEVVEVGFGTPWADVLPPSWSGRALLVGGFHGAWVPWAAITGGRVSVDAMRAAGTPMGAGVVLAPGECPVTFTARVVDYLAAQSARRCGPCLNGLPALADAVHAVADGWPVAGDVGRIEALAATVTGRGACAHPDGTARLVRSMLAAFPAEVALHGGGRCTGARGLLSGVAS